ncbi:ribosomal protein L20 [Acrasis kona]|uniref:Ribosomal protein L20 n=1 Tax=Acrasis kona TaxID=1008807 RepID=A0AAW2YVN0_9EUKA
MKTLTSNASPRRSDRLALKSKNEIVKHKSPAKKSTPIKPIKKYVFVTSPSERRKKHLVKSDKDQQKKQEKEALKKEKEKQREIFLASRISSQEVVPECALTEEQMQINELYLQQRLNNIERNKKILEDLNINRDCYKN